RDDTTPALPCGLPLWWKEQWPSHFWTYIWRLTDMTLEEIRKEIDQVDSQMKALFLRRRKAAQEVAKVKAQTHDKVLKPDREQAMLDRLGADLSGQERAEYCSFLRKLVALSRKCQYHQLLAL